MSDSESSESSEDDILVPNGFVDVNAEHVNTDFDQNNGESSPPQEQNGQAYPSESSTDLVGLGSESSIQRQNLDDSCTVEEVLVEDTRKRGRKRGRKKTTGSSRKTRKSCRLTPQNSSLTDMDESITIDLNPDATVNYDLSMTEQSIFSFDEEQTPLPVEEDPNILVTIRVVWKGCNTRHFSIRKFQKIKEIYTYYAQLEGIPEEQILFSLRDTPVSPNNTPLSLNIGVSSLEGGVIDVADVASCTSQRNDQGDPNAMKLLVQRQGSKERHTVFTYPHEKISVLISKLSEDLKIQSTLIKLKFDGDILDADSTPSDYDLEGEECIDLIITK